MAAPTDAAARDDDSQNKITITIAKPRQPGAGFAKRCAIGGDPLSASCVGGSEGIALDAAGTLYLANGDRVHRYTPVAGEPCKLEPAGEPLVMPPDNPRPQPLGKGPVYMRSGGVAWEVMRVGDAVYALDFLVGLFRVDRGKVEPVCTEQFGFKSIVKLGKRVLARRKGIEELVLGKRGACKAKSAGIDDKLRDELFVVGDTLFTGFSKLRRHDGREVTELADGVRLCAITAITACGDGACVIDHNCPQIVQLAADGSVVRTIEDDQLFDARPWSIDAAVTAADGTIYLYARHRDKVGDKDVCEAAVYAIPPAVFAR